MRKIVFVCLVVIIGIFSIPLMMYYKIRNNESSFYIQFLHPTFKFILKILNVQINIHGEIPPSFSGTLIVANHTSIMDIAVLIAVINHNIIFVSKEENSKIPLINSWLKITKTILIKRSDLKQTLKQMLKVTSVIENGGNVMIFPQGTRNTKSINFKPGTFKFVSRAKGDIFPIGIKGPNQILKGLSYKKKVVDLYINDIVKYDVYKEEDLIQVVQKIENKIKAEVL